MFLKIKFWKKYKSKQISNNKGVILYHWNIKRTKLYLTTDQLPMVRLTLSMVKVSMSKWATLKISAPGVSYIPMKMT